MEMDCHGWSNMFNIKVTASAWMPSLDASFIFHEFISRANRGGEEELESRSGNKPSRR